MVRHERSEENTNRQIKAREIHHLYYLWSLFTRAFHENINVYCTYNVQLYCTLRHFIFCITVDYKWLLRDRETLTEAVSGGELKKFCVFVCVSVCVCTHDSLEVLRGLVCNEQKQKTKFFNHRAQRFQVTTEYVHSEPKWSYTS